MLFSCKVSNSVLTYLTRQGEDSNSLVDSIGVTEDFLRDANCWMNAAEMESFLEQVQRQPFQKIEDNILQKAGHSGPELRSWGVLDSVLRMMPRPQEIFTQPDRFLSYFISPAPPVANILRDENCIEFDLPIPAEQFPLISTYLKAAFESLPLYVGKPMGTCTWQGTRLRIEWNSSQPSIFNEEEVGHQLSPDLLRTLVASLEKQTPVAKSHLPQHDFIERQKLDDQKSEILKGEIARLADYMVRAQQLITLLMGQGRMSPEIKEAMRRVDWERVQKQFPLTVEHCRELLENKDFEQKPMGTKPDSQENLSV